MGSPGRVTTGVRLAVEQADPGDWPTTARQCADGTHADCPHAWGAGGHLTLRKPYFHPQVGLCPCTCHDACPLAGKKTVDEDKWQERCTCPAAAEEGSRKAATREKMQQRRGAADAEIALVQPDVHVGPGNTPESIRAELLSSLDQRRIDRVVALWGAASSRGPAPVVAVRVLREHFRPLVEIGRMLRSASQAAEPDKTHR